MTKDEALRMALKSLEFYYDLWKEKVDAQTIAAIREALAQPEFVLNGIDCSCGRKWRVVNNTLTASEQPEQEPVAWDGKCVLGHCGSPAGCEDSDCCRADFTTPPQRKPLTEREILDLLPDAQNGWTTAIYGKWVARAVERAHGIKE